MACPDKRGIVAALAQALFEHGANILDADQHTDPIAMKFFQRVRFDLSLQGADRDGLERALAALAGRFGMSYRLGYADKVKRVALLVSRYDHCLYDLLLRHRSGELGCEIPVIVSNHADLGRVAEQFEIPFHVLPVSPETRLSQEEAMAGLLDSFRIDLVVLARYMQVLGQPFLDRFPGRIINIHHSFLPAFTGGKPYVRAHERGVKLIGATAHYVTADLDEGPIIEQDVVRASHRDTVEDLVRKGRDLEKLVLSRAVRWHIEDRVLVYGNKTVVFS